MKIQMDEITKDGILVDEITENCDTWDLQCSK